MSIDRSLRTKSSLERHRNVLSRAERITRLMVEERFDEQASPLGLPKVAHRKAQTGKKKTKKGEEGAAEKS
jgi:small basic protein (TIGR04137 family)